MKKILFSLVLIITFGCNAQKKEVNAVKDEAGNLVGVADKNSFLNDEEFNEWFSFNYEDYSTDKNVIEKLKNVINKDISIKAFMGTWCGDSQEQIPVFYKVLDEAGFDYAKLEMITVNRSKKTPDNLQEGLDIERVPTFIFYNKEGKEMGRFVEYPRETIEADFLKIVSGLTYKHSYED